jgi:hypothetical protein
VAKIGCAHAFACIAGWALLPQPFFTAKAVANLENAGDARAGLQYLDLEHKSLVRHVELSSRDLPVKFVQIRIAEVNNPHRTGLTFDVEFQSDNGKRIALGTFSLYPADHPGTFIVATQGQVKSAGSVIVTYHTTDPVDPAAPPVVGVGSIELRP